MPFLSERVFDANMQDIYRPHLQWIAQQTDEARDQLIRLANINSGSLHASGVRRMAEAVRDLFAPLQADAEIIDVPPFQATAGDGQLRNAELGPALRLRHRPEAPLQVFLGGHLDTVFPKESSFQQVRQSAEDELHGPGVADLKGGILVAYNALRALERSPWADQIGWQVVLNPDEEIGSASSMPILLESAAQCDLGLVYEPSFPDGNLAGARKGSGNFDVIVRGRAAHAGREHHLGRNAIRACADFISALDALNGQRDGVTINPGFVRGGGALNVVPELCITKFNVRTSRAEDEAWMQAELDRLLAEVRSRDGIELELRGGFTRPPKPANDAIRKLSTMIQDCGGDLGLQLEFQPTGGCCDGNNLAAAGLPNIDNLGVVGGAIHSDKEYMRISSLAERAQLSALLLMRLASGEWAWH